MATEIGALRALLSLDSAAFVSGAKRAEASMGNLQAKLARTAAKMKTIGKRMSVAVSAPLVAAASVAVKSSLSTIDAQSKMAQSLGTSTRSIQTLARAADRAGVSTGELEQISRQLTKRLSEAATGGGPAAGALERLGLTAAELSDMPLDKKIQTINAAIEKTVPAAERAAVATDLFGSRAGLIAGRIDAATIAAASAEMDRFGVAVSEVDADAIEAANDAISALGLVSRGLANQMAAALAPTLQRVAEFLADIGAAFAALTPAQKKFAAVTATIAAVIGPLTIGLGIFMASLSALAPLFAAVAGAAALVLSPIGLIVAAFAATAAGIGYMIARFGSVGAAFDAFKALAARVFEAVAARVETAGMALQALALDAAAAGADFAANLIARAEDAVRGMVDGFLGLGEKITAQLATAWEAVKVEVGAWADRLAGIAADMVSRMLSAFGGLGSSIVGELQAAWETVKAEVGAWPERLRQAGLDMIAGLVSGLRGNDAVEGAARDAAATAADAVKDEADINSPSKVWAGMGADMIDGLAQGIDGADPAIAAAEGAAERVTDGLSKKLRDRAAAARAQADALRAEIEARNAAPDGTAAAVARLDEVAAEAAETMNSTSTATGTAATSTERLGAAAERAKAAFAGLGAAGGGAAGGGAAGIGTAIADSLSTAIAAAEQQAKSTADQIKGTFLSAFKGVATGAQTMGDAVSNVLSGLADMLLTNVGNALFGGLSQALAPAFAPIPGFANGTSSAPGGLAWVGERGRELVDLPRGSRVIPNHRLPDAGAAQGVTVRLVGGGLTLSDSGQIMTNVSARIERASSETEERTLARAPGHLEDQRMRMG